MKRNLYIAVGLLAGLFLVQDASAFTANTANGTLSIPSSNVPGAPATLNFNPSTNVILGGNSVSTSFLINGYHTQALAKAAGQGYAMAADSNKMYFVSIEATGTTAAKVQVAGTNSLGFTVASGYVRM